MEWRDGVCFNGGRKTKEPIRVSVKLNSVVNSSSCVKIVSDILKYILYQRHQIPVQFDVLAREAAKDEHEEPELSEDYHSDLTSVIVL